MGIIKMNTIKMSLVQINEVTTLGACWAVWGGKFCFGNIFKNYELLSLQLS